MKLKPNETVITAFSKHFKRIFGGNTTYGEIAKVKYDCPRCFGSGSEIESPEGTTCQRYIICETCNGTGTISKVKQNSDNLMGNHVAEYLKDQSDFIKKQQGDI